MWSPVSERPDKTSPWENLPHASLSTGVVGKLFASPVTTSSQIERMQNEEGPEEDVAHQHHYEALAIQPIDYITKNNLGYMEGNVVKYVSRYKLKGGKRDLLKAREYLNRLIEESK